MGFVYKYELADELNISASKLKLFMRDMRSKNLIPEEVKHKKKLNPVVSAFIKDYVLRVG